MRNLFLFILALVCSNAFAQMKTFEQHIGWRGNQIELHTFSDKSKEQVCSVLMSKDSIIGFIANKDNAYRESFALRRGAGQQMRGGFFRDGKVFLFVDNGSDAVHCWKIDPVTIEIDEHIIPFDFKKDRIANHFSCGDRFLVFAINKKNDELIIHDFTSESKYTTAKHKLDENMWKELTEMSNFSRTLALEKMDFEGNSSIELAASRNKLYLRGDTLLLLTTAKIGSTKLLSFNLQDQKMEQKVFYHSVNSGNYADPSKYYVDNSYLLKGKVYYAWATVDSLGLEVMDLYSGARLKGYGVQGEGKIDFKNTEILQQSSNTSSGAARELRNTRQLLRHMIKGTVVVAATLNKKGQVELTVGSYERIYERTLGEPGIPGGMHQTDDFTTAHFKMLVDPNTGEHLPGNIDHSINELIERYTTGIKIPREAENLFYYNGNYYYAFYNKEDRKLAVVQF